MDKDKFERAKKLNAQIRSYQKIISYFEGDDWMEFVRKKYSVDILIYDETLPRNQQFTTRYSLTEETKMELVSFFKDKVKKLKQEFESL